MATPLEEAYIEFSGDDEGYIVQPREERRRIIPGVTYAEAVIKGIEKYWSSPNIGASIKWDFEGKPITVNTSVIQRGSAGLHSSQRFVTFVIDSAPTDKDNVMSSGYYGNWNVAGTGAGRKEVSLYTAYFTDEDEFMRTVGHEFGHVVGVGDAYILGDAFSTTEVPIEDFMRYANKTHLSTNLPYVTANNIEMMWEAYRTGKWQYYDSPKSSVIGSY